MSGFNSNFLHIVPISGGKDSQATALWAFNTIPQKWGKQSKILLAFNDTGWEAEETYRHLDYLEKSFGQPIIRLKSQSYPGGLLDLASRKGLFPSAVKRFCTEKLKIEPMVDFILSLKCHVFVYLGQRRQESFKRAKLPDACMYFKYYFQPYGHDRNGRPLYDSYRKDEVKAWCKKYNGDIVRPILDWTTEDVFDYIAANGQIPNPLYAKGFSRVGCFPCVLCRHKEVRLIAKHYPERILEIAEAETTIDSTFYRVGYIPDHACSRTAFVTGKTVEGFTEGSDTLFPGYVHADRKRPDYLSKLPRIDDIVRYLELKEEANGGSLFPAGDLVTAACDAEGIHCE